MSQFTRTTIDSVLKDSPSGGHLLSLYHVAETLLLENHPRKFLPLVEMLKAKHSSLWSWLSFSQQEKLLTLLEQMKPKEQERFLRVVKKQGWISPYVRIHYISELFSLLIRLHSTDRSHLLRRLEPMVQQERQKLISVVGRLNESEQVELLGILDDIEALEQKALLNVMLNTTCYNELERVLKLMKTLIPVDRSRLLIVLDGLDSTSQHRLLRVLEHSSHCHELIDLPKSMNPQEHTKFISVMGSVQESERVELFGILDELEAPEQRILLNVLDSSGGSSCYQIIFIILLHMHTEKLTKVLVPLDWSRLLRILIGLGIVQRDLLLKVLEQTSRQHELIEAMDRLKPLEQLQLLRVMLGGVNSAVKLSMMVDEILSSPMRMSEMVNQHEQQQQLKRVVKELGHLQQKYNFAVPSMDDARLLSKAANLMYLRLQQRKGRLSLDQSSLQQCLEKLEPLERKQLPRVLSRLNVSGLSQQVEILYKEELKGVDVCSMLSDAYELLMEMEYETLLQRLLLLFVCLLSIYLSEADPHGGFGNLLLDGWWLEFWEIILLAAGDVERNPGPRRMTDEELRTIDARIIGKDNIFDVYDAVYDCRPKWRNLCLALRLSPVDLSAIDEKRRGDPKACLEDGLTLWLQGHYDTDTHGPPTWRMMVDAVANSAGGDNHTLAVDIAKKHKALPIVPPQDQLQIVDRLREARKRSEEMSSSFNIMYRPVIGILRNVDVGEVKECLRYLTDPQEFDKLCVPPRVYKRAATTKDLLDRLCPQYINPGNTFVLEEIVEKFGSRRCKRLVREYVSKFM